MITIYNASTRDYSTHGLGVLTPTAAAVKHKAGADYSFTLTHPAAGLWRYIVPGNIIKMPVPAEQIGTAVTGENVQIWRAKLNTWLYAKPVQPQSIRFGEWAPRYPGEILYKLHQKVTVTAANGSYTNWICINGDFHGNESLIPPPESFHWQSFPTQTEGAAQTALIKAGEEFYLLEEQGAYWLYAQTRIGAAGYIPRSMAEYVRTVSVEEEPPRTITDQLFRIETVQTDSAKRTVTASGRHVSYDLQGALVGDCELKDVTPAAALSRMTDALIYPIDTTVATNLSDEDGLFSGSFSWKNPVACLLDPDTGIVDTYRARLVRDNWDVFILRDTAPYSGVTVRYGSNMRGCTCARSGEDLVTRIVPVGQKANGDPLTLPELWVDSDNIDLYPVILTEYLATDVKIGAEGGPSTEDEAFDLLRARARDRYAVDKCDLIKVTVKVDFVLLGDTAEYAAWRNLQHVHLYDIVGVYDADLSIAYELPVREYDWDPIRSRFNSLTLGDVYDSARTVSGFNLRDNCIDFSKLSPSAIARIKSEVTV